MYLWNLEEKENKEEKKEEGRKTSPEVNKKKENKVLSLN